jgi:hypothetical protein
MPRRVLRSASVWTSIERVGQDVRYAGRLLRRRPVLSATAILTLMLGMGGTTAVFSLMDALLLRDLPVERPGELVRLAERRSDGTSAEAFTLCRLEARLERIRSWRCGRSDVYLALKAPSRAPIRIDRPSRIARFERVRRITEYWGDSSGGCDGPGGCGEEQDSVASGSTGRNPGTD